MERTAGENALIDFVRNYILNNWEAFSDRQVIDICNAIISNDQDAYDDIIVNKEVYWRRLNAKNQRELGDALARYQEYDPKKLLVYCDYYGDLSPELPENSSRSHCDKVAKPISMNPSEVRTKVGPLALDILKHDFFVLWDEPWELLLPALGLPTDMICNAFFFDD